VAELRQERDHGRSHEPIRFIEEQHQGPLGERGEAGEIFQQRGRGVAEHRSDFFRIGPGQLRVLQAERAVDVLEDRGQRCRWIGLLARGLEIDPHSAPAPGGVEVPLEPHQRRGLARLSAGVQREILALFDQLLDAPEAPLRRKHVMLAWNAWAGGVE